MWIDSRGATVLVPSECKRLLAVTAKNGGIGRLGYRPIRHRWWSRSTSPFAMAMS